MKINDIIPGVIVEARTSPLDKQLLEGVVESICNGVCEIKLSNEVSVSYPVSRLNFEWRFKTLKKFANIGELNLGNKIRLGRCIGKTFIPGDVVLFIDAFIKDSRGNYFLLGKNLNRKIEQKLKINDFRKKWVIEG